MSNLLELGSLGLAAIVLGYTIRSMNSQGWRPYAFMVFGLAILTTATYFDKTRISKSDLLLVTNDLVDLPNDIGEAKKHMASADRGNLEKTLERMGNNTGKTMKKVTDALR